MKEFAKNSEVQVLDALVAAIELRDAYTKGHSKRVAYFASALAKTLQLTDHEIKDIYFAGLVHDLGKIGIPDVVLLKPERLTEAEYAMIKEHSNLSAVIINTIDAWRHLIPLVRHHHERMDGQGYPDGLIGENIPLGARVLAIADIYDALTSRRVYREGMPQEQAKCLLQEMAHDGHIDLNLTEVFVKNIHSYSLPEDSDGIYLKNLEIARNTFFYKDSLTSLFNRNALLILIKKAIVKKLHVTLIKFDIKAFKEINSKYGILHGDKLLTQIGVLLKQYSPLSEIIDVNSGDIFACRTMADNFLLLYVGDAVDYFDFKVDSIIKNIETNINVKLKIAVIIYNYSSDQTNSLEWGYLI
ncbi:MAG: HD domain-containing protein [Thiovulaceae bacterium]|nr:HD domain-containing protein [Sulfurimonadaceae bacterium]